MQLVSGVRKIDLAYIMKTSILLQVNIQYLDLSMWGTKCKTKGWRSALVNTSYKMKTVFKD